jgi:prolyl-tRNA editing enzyme YbaK/EbsC (Cys-tRNA(Pro) deacylase)
MHTVLLRQEMRAVCLLLKIVSNGNEPSQEQIIKTLLLRVRVSLLACVLTQGHITK